jgi:aromatic ring-opening dioxygenase LigB subunit
MPIVFACLAPHPPIILPKIGSPEDRLQTQKTIKALEKLAERLKDENPEKIIISSPHKDWGFDVPLFFLAKDFRGRIEKILIGTDEPRFYFEEGKKFREKDSRDPARLAVIASGDLSHCLKEEGPYGFHPDGQKFDRAFIEALEKKDIETILKLDRIYPEAGECGLRSFSFALGMLAAAGIDYRPEILSYQGPFGVGYLVADFKVKR